ncbi:hypothetical protein ACFL2Q_09000 [Thermodesulfobacteriota bacterium]
MTIRPTISEPGVFEIAGVYSLRTLSDQLNGFQYHGNLSPPYSGIPPFEQDYTEPASAAFADDPPITSWEHFWFSFGSPRHVEVWMGAKPMSLGTGATWSANFKNELAAISYRTSHFKFVLGTGAAVPRNRPNHSLETPLPSGPVVLTGYTAAYGLVTTAYAAVICGLVCLASLCPKDDSDEEDDGESLLFDLLSGLFSALGSGGDDDEAEANTEKETEQNSKDSEEDEAGPEEDDGGSSTYSLFSLAYDYSLAVGDRKPFHLFLAEHRGKTARTGLGLLWYPHLSNFGKTDPEGPISIQSTSVQPTADPVDDHALVWILYLKYRKRDLFANVEYGYFGWDIYSPEAPHRFGKGYHLFAETGAHIGPAKVSFMFALASGLRLDNCEPHQRHMRFPINHGVMEPYESLIFHTFGGGNRTFEGPPWDRHGMMSDAYAFGIRVDYAVAANLGVWSSCLWANRLEREGTRFGHYLPTGQEATPLQRISFAGPAGRQLVGPPDDYGYVSESFLGYEFNLGAQWKVTDGLSLNLRWAYRQPGGWFTEAHQALRPYGSGAGRGVGIGVLKKRPAIQGLNASLAMDF